MISSSSRGRPLSLALTLAAAINLSACGLGLSDDERLERAHRSFEQGDVRAAIIDAKRVLQRGPDKANARLLLGRASLAAGDAEGAEKELRRSIELGIDRAVVLPDIVAALNQLRRFEDALVAADQALEFGLKDASPVYVMRGEAFLGLDQAQDALESFTHALQLNPDAVQGQLGMSKSYAALDERKSSIAALDRLVEMSFDDPLIWSLSAELNADVGRAEIAKEQYAYAIKIARSTGDLRAEAVALGSQIAGLLNRGGVQKATKLLDALKLIAPAAVQTQILEARLALETRDWMSAQEILRQVVNQAPEFKSGRLLLGLAYMRDGKFLQAEVYLADAVRIDPDNAHARLLLAEARLRLDNAKQAEEVIQPLLVKSDQDSQSLLAAARISFGSGNQERAADYLLRSADASPENPELGLQIALALIATDHLERADALLRNINANNDEEVAFRRDSLVAVAKLKAGDVQGAMAAAGSMTQTYPENPHSYEFLGAVGLFAGEHDAARQNFENASRLGTDYVVAQRNLALVDEAEGNFDSAASHYRRILSLDPQAIWAMLAMARLEHSRQETGAAVAWLERAAKVEAGGLESQRLLARLYVSERRFDKAEVVIAKSLADHPNNAEFQFMAGLVAVGQNRIEDAAERFSKASSLAPDHNDYRLHAIIALDKSGRKDKARKLLLNTNADALLENLTAGAIQIRYFIEQQDLDSALSLSTRLRGHYKDKALTHALLGEVHAAMGNYSAAAMTYDEALSVSRTRELAIRASLLRRRAGLADSDKPLEEYLLERPDDKNAMLVLAESKTKSGDTVRAQRIYEDILRIDSKNGVALNNLAWVYRSQNDERALQVAKRAYQLLPTNASVRDTYGSMLVANGQIQEGIRKLRSALAEKPDNEDIAMHLAQALSKAGEVAEAREILDNLLASDIDQDSRMAAEDLLAELNS